MYKFIVFLVFCFSFDANAQHFPGKNGNIKLSVSEQIILQENLSPFGYAGDVLVMDSLLFLTTYNPAGVLIYDRDGLQKRPLTSKGRGPSELLMPNLIQRKDSNIVVWDASQLKFTEFTTNGEPVGEYTGVKQSIGDFFAKGDTFFTYNTGYLDGPLISSYSLKRNDLKPLEEIGSLTEDHKKLLRYVGTRPITVEDHHIYYARADKPEFFRYDLRSGREKRIKIRDRNFNVNKSSFSMNAFGVKADNDWIEFIFTNSRFKGIYTVGEYVIAELNHGSLYDGSRIMKYFFFTKDLKLIDEITLEYDDMLRYGGGAITTYESGLVFYMDFPDNRTPTGRFARDPDRLYPYEHFYRKLTFFEVTKIEE